MRDEDKTKSQLVSELKALRGRVEELEAATGALEKAKDRYQKFAAASLDGIVVTRDGVIVESDDTIASIARRDPSDLVGMEFGDLVPDEQPEVAKSRLLSEEESSIEAELLREDGTSVPVEISSKTLSREEGTAKITAIRDLTPVKVAQETAVVSEERFRAIFQASPDLIFTKDLDLRLTDVNPAMERLFNITAKQLIGTREEELYESRAAKQIRRWDQRAFQGHTVEDEHTRRIGGESLTFLDTRVPIRNARNEIIGICCLCRNITERTKARPRVTVSEHKYPSKTMRSTLKQAARIAATDGIVLLLGESGSGKDYLARWIHDHSERSNSPYFALNCAALPSELAESELFGHEAGAFTGARGRKKGMLELAEGGTLLLNEIGELPLPLQAKLLSFLDTRSFLRVGGQKSVTVDARLMAATHRELVAEVDAERFLEPLFYRLNVLAIRVPSLRERQEDIPMLLEEIVHELALQMQLPEVPPIDPFQTAGLKAYAWPGNVRELRNVIERALMLWNSGTLDLKLPSHAASADEWARDLPFPSGWTLRQVTDEITKVMCTEALRRAKGNKKEAAAIMGISRDALYRYIKRFGIAPDMLS
jgi:PAS domain S-box-containing protein